MKAGDIIRLKQAIRPELSQPQLYQYGMVIKVLNADTAAPESDALAMVLVHLYDPLTQAIYTDEWGVQAIYSFRQDEVEPL
jgi:hypothetical protein